MDNIEWGELIPAANNDKPIPWLKPDEMVWCIWDKDTQAGPFPVGCVSGWGDGFRIKLPGGHWAYSVLAKGFTPWGGGDEAPGDWDGGEVLFRNGNVVESCCEWKHPWDGENGTGQSEYDVIGYKPRAEPTPTFKAGDYVVPLDDDPCDDYIVGNVYVMASDGVFTDDAGDKRPIEARPVRHATPAEIKEYLAEANRQTVTLPLMTEEEAMEYVGDGTLAAFRRLGLIRPATDIERFEDFHGGLDNNQRDIAEMAIKWARENG